MKRLAASLALLAACASPSSEPPPRAATPTALRVRGVAVRPAEGDTTAALVGRLDPHERVMLAARLAGVVTEVRVDLGDRVRQGQALAVVSVPGLGAQIEGAAATDEVARREAELRRDAADRAAAVSARNPAAIAAQDVVSARAAVATAQARVGVAAAEARRLRALLSETRLVAPFDGVVVSRRKDRGASAAAGEVVLELARVDRLRLRVSVPEGQAGFLRVGSPLHATLPTLGGRRLEAAVSRLAPALDPATRMLAVEADVPNPDGALLAGIRVELQITARPSVTSLAVPSEAVLSEGGASVVYVADGAVARRRVVRVGYDNGIVAAVTEGVGAGDVVLLGGRGLLRDGIAVEVAR